MSKRKKLDERRHAIIRVDIQALTQEIVGYFFGELCAIARIPESEFIFGFIYDLEHQNTKVYSLDMESENGDL